MNWERVTELFDGAMRRPPGERARWLDEECPDDVVVRREVSELLAAFDAPDDAPRTPFADLLSGERLDPPSELRPGTQLGGYELVREIGRGGMGSVFEARRTSGDFEHRVAIKTIGLGSGHREVLSRFRRERRILARLSHRNIAALYDGGVTEAGLPWFAMEFVDGTPIDAYCRTRALSIPDRIALLRQVCSAVHYAHRNLVVHRDLKPSNILVAADGTVKLLDFGIAKILAPDDSSEVGDDLTQAGPGPLTTAYASPEQLREEPVTTASDIHALGLVCYSVLAGRHPFRIERMPSSELRRRILEAAPPPSGLGVEVDAILTTALRKEPERRYASVEQLSEDLHRFLTGRPVSARPDTVGYRWRKFAQRNRVAVTASAIAVLALVAGLVGSIRQAQVAAAERDRARLEAQKANRVTAFVQDMLRAADPRQSGPNLTVAQALAAAAARADTSLAAEPDVRAAVQTSIGLSYLALGRLDEAEALLRRALDTRKSLGGELEIASGLRHLAQVYSERGEIAPTESLYRASVAAYRRAQVFDSVTVGNLLNELGDILQYKGELDEAEQMQREALVLRIATTGARSPDVAASLNNIAVIYGIRGQWAVAESLHREATAIVTERLGQRHPDVASGLNALASAVQSRGRLAEAESLYRRALDVRIAAFGARHPETARTQVNLGWLMHDVGRFAEALQLADAVLSQRRALGDGHPVVASNLVMRGQSLCQVGQHKSGERDLREALRLRRDALPPGHWLIATTESGLGECLFLQGRRGEALPLLEGSHERLRELRSDDHDATRAAKARLDRARRTTRTSPPSIRR